ncbi:MAG: HAMP domain-containing protein [Propionibacteriaceae bacterium]|jgi:signal transduction histidine kinase|nr:HAMP domain-containing protein [Propionibacteriaceae bacterium]
MSLNLRGVTFRGWAATALLGVTAMALTLFLQFSPLLNFLTERVHWWDIQKSGEQILRLYGQTGGEAQISRLAVDKSYEVLIETSLDHVVLWVDGADPNPIAAPLDDSDLTPEWKERLRPLAEELQASGLTVLKSTRHYQAESTTYIYFARIEDPSLGTCYLYLARAYFEASDTATRVIQIQILFAAILMMALAVIAALPAARRMTRPIVRLTKSAQRLAHGDLSVAFDGRGFTETEQLADTLTYAAAQLRELDADRKEFLANISHDLKTPLTIIRIYGETIRDVSGDDPAKRQAHCDTIIEEANRLTDLVNEIVEISRLESGTVTVALTEIDLAAVLRDTLASFAILAESEGYDFDFTIADSVPIIGNAHFMKRAFYNLIGNAVNYTGDDRYVGVSLTTHDGVARFEVSDTGAGISPDKIATIWDRYYKSRGNHARAVTGSGLGLSIVKRILTLHNARFGVTSQPSEGSCFWFECDLAPAGQAKAELPVEAAPPPSDIRPL